MSTILVEDIDQAHAQARALVDQLFALHHGNGGYGWDCLGELTAVGLTSFTGDPASPGSWWMTDAGLRMLDIQPARVDRSLEDGYQVAPGPKRVEATTPLYAVTWRAEGVRHATRASLNLETARECVSALIAALRDGERISRVTVLDEAGVDVTSDVARGLIPHADELAHLASRAELLAGLIELHSFLKANLGVPVSRRPALSVHTRFLPGVIDTDDARRDAVYVAAAALGVEAKTDDDGAYLAAERKFGSITYRVSCVSAAAQERYSRVQVEGERVVTEQEAENSRPVSPAGFHPAGPVGWSAGTDGGTGE